MSDSDPHDDRDSDADPERPREARNDPSSLVHLGIDVGIGSLTDLLGGVLGARGASRRNRGEWQRVDETTRADADGTAGTDTSDTDEPIGVADEYLVDTHRADDEFVVRAELPGVSEEDLSVGIDVHADELVIAADGRTIDRIALPWSSTEAAKVWYNNGVLDVRLRPAEDEAGRDDGS